MTTTSKQIFNIGDKIYPVDFSYFKVNNEKDFINVCNYKTDEIEDKLRNHNPLIVVSLPYRRDNDEKISV